MESEENNSLLLKNHCMGVSRYSGQNYTHFYKKGFLFVCLQTAVKFWKTQGGTPELEGKLLPRGFSPNFWGYGKRKSKENYEVAPENLLGFQRRGM